MKLIERLKRSHRAARKKPRVFLKAKARCVREAVQGHFRDSTAIMATVNPVLMALETNFVGLSYTKSIGIRTLSTTASYLGLGSLYSQLREYSKRKFGINKASETAKNIHDFCYNIAYISILCPIFYRAMGETDPWKIALGTAVTLGMSVPMGIPVGYAIEIGKDVTGKEECEREYYPNLMKKRHPLIKKTIALGYVAACYASMWAYYNHVPDRHAEPSNQPVVERVETGGLENRVVEIE